MKTTFLRIWKTGMINFRRNGVVSFVSVLVATITLSVILSLILLQGVLSNTLQHVADKVDVTIYFDPDTKEDTILSLKDKLQVLPEVASIVYTSEDTALANFRVRHQDDYLTLQALDELSSNPLGATLSLRTKDITQYESVVNLLGDGSVFITPSDYGISKINYNQNKLIIDRLTKMINGARTFGLGLTLIFLTISVVISFTTVRLTIYFMREEIGVMRLVGASKMYIRGPFMVEGVIHGLIASLITIVLFWPLTFWMGTNLTTFLGINLFSFFLSHLIIIILILIGSGSLIGVVSSFIAMRKYLRK